MNRKAFVFSTTSFLLIIPAVILASSFMAMLETGSSGVFLHLRGEKTFSLFETAETDLDRATDISGRRAVLAVADYALTYGECLNSTTYNNPPYGTGATGAIKELMITGNLTSVGHAEFTSSLMPGATLNDWSGAFPERADALGFNVSLGVLPDDLYITPVNDTWFYATLKANATIVNIGGNITYNGTLPRTGNTTRLIDGSGINATIFNCTETGVNSPPDSTISSPSDGDTLSCTATDITGTATDDSGVSRVDVNISGTWHLANLTSPGATSTGWNYSWTPGADGNYTMCSHAVDNNLTGQTTDYCIDTTVSGCSVGTCKIILDPSYTPQTSGNNRRVLFSVLNNDPSDTVTIDNMTVIWDKAGVALDWIMDPSSPAIWNGCEDNNPVVVVLDINDISISSGATRVFNMRFRTATVCSSNTNMLGTDFTVAFGTDQGACSVDFSV